MELFRLRPNVWYYSNIRTDYWSGLSYSTWRQVLASPVCARDRLKIQLLISPRVGKQAIQLRPSTLFIADTKLAAGPDRFRLPMHVSKILYAPAEHTTVPSTVFQSSKRALPQTGSASHGSSPNFDLPPEQLVRVIRDAPTNSPDSQHGALASDADALTAWFARSRQPRGIT